MQMKLTRSVVTWRHVLNEASAERPDMARNMPKRPPTEQSFHMSGLPVNTKGNRGQAFLGEGGHGACQTAPVSQGHVRKGWE
ncbi:hypothetical protein MHYP_G00045850 [Metynnis hypsauchen]